MVARSPTPLVWVNESTVFGTIKKDTEKSRRGSPRRASLLPARTAASSYGPASTSIQSTFCRCVLVVSCGGGRSSPRFGDERHSTASVRPWRRRAQSANWRRRRAQATNGRRRAVGVVVSDSEEELEVLRQPGMIEQLTAVVTQRASCVIELEGGAPLTIRPATQRRRPYPPPTKHLLY